MADFRLKNDFSIDSIVADSAATAADFTNRLGRKGNINQKLAKYKDNNTNVAMLKFPSTTPKYFMKLVAHTYRRDSLLKLNTKTMVGNVILPLPGQMIDTNSVAYREDDIGPVVGTGVNATFR